MLNVDTRRLATAPTPEKNRDIDQVSEQLQPRSFEVARTEATRAVDGARTSLVRSAREIGAANGRNSNLLTTAGFDRAQSAQVGMDEVTAEIVAETEAGPEQSELIAAARARAWNATENLTTVEQGTQAPLRRAGFGWDALEEEQAIPLGQPFAEPTRLGQPRAQRIAQGIPQRSPQQMQQGISQQIPEGIADAIPQGFGQSIPQGNQQAIPQGIQQAIPQAVAQGISRAVPQAVSQGTALDIGLAQAAIQTGVFQSTVTPMQQWNPRSVVNPAANLNIEAQRIAAVQDRSSEISFPQYAAALRNNFLEAVGQENRRTGETYDPYQSLVTVPV